MNFKRFMVGTVVAISLAACGGSSKSGPDGTGVMTPSQGGLWKLAPADSVAGVVLADGTLTTTRSWFVEFMRIADARTDTKEIADELRRELQQMPFNPLDDASLAGAGLDISKGAAIFVNQQEEISVVLPISDRKAFAGLVGGSTTMEGGIEVETFEGGRMMCKMAGERYVCATSAERLQMVGASPTNRLAEAASALPANMNGQAQMLVDAATYRLGSKLDGLDRYITDAGMLAVSATMSRGKLAVRGHLPGVLVGAGKKLAAAPSALAGKIGAERPSGFLRVRLDPSAFPIPNDEVVPGVNLGAIVGSMTGELVSFSHAGVSGSAAIQLGLNSPDPLRQLVKMGCDMSGMIPFLGLKSEGSACKGTVKLAGMGPMAQIFAKSEVAVEMTVHGDRLESRMSMGDMGPVTNAPSPSKLGSELLSGSWNIAAWAEGLSPIYLADLINANVLRRNAGKEMNMALWLIGHIYEGGMGVGFRDDGMHAVLEVTSFAAATDEDYAGYEAALGKAIDGDINGAKSALLALSKKNPEGIIARQVGLQSGAWIGAAAAAMGPAFLMFTGRMEESPAVPAMP